jgi:glycosyltransferase involved in cell wall biosynthesis
VSLHAAVAGWLLGPASGANQRLLGLLRALPAQLTAGERITVLHRPDYRPPDVPGIAWHSVPIPAGPSWRRAWAERQLLPRLLHGLRATVYDHGFLPMPAVGVPTVLLLHDLRHLDGWSLWPGGLRWVARRLLQDACARAAAIVVPSAFTAERLRVHAPAAHSAQVIGNAVMVPALSATPRGKHLLHVGHLEARKNLAVVLRALALLPATQRPSLQLVGRDAGAGQSWRRLANQLGIAASVQWLGSCDEITTTQLYKSARAVVVPSHYEGFGLCALEGLAHGLPVLAANAGALPEVLGNHGVLLPPADPAAWAKAIAALPDDEEPLGATATQRREVARSYRPEHAAAQLVTVWRQASGAMQSPTPRQPPGGTGAG